jgi:hypothetical protein
VGSFDEVVVVMKMIGAVVAVLGLAVAAAGCSSGGTGGSGGGGSASSAESVATQFINDVTSGQSAAALGLTEQGNATITQQFQTAIPKIAQACRGTAKVQMVPEQRYVTQADFSINGVPCDGSIEVRVLGNDGWKVDRIDFEGENLVF